LRRFSAAADERRSCRGSSPPLADVLGEDGFARALTQKDLDYLLG
jgi:hypothetical protein